VLNSTHWSYDSDEKILKTYVFDYNFPVMTTLSRRDFLKLGGLSLGSLAFTPTLQNAFGFDDSNIVRVATNSVSVYSKPSDQSSIVSTWYRDELVHVYSEVIAEEPKYNPVWYRVWGGYMHRARLQRVKILFNEIIPSIPEGEQRLAEVTVPVTSPWRKSKAFGWEKLNPPIYFGSVHWIVEVVTGPDGEAWYRIFDDLDSNVPYYLSAKHMRPIAPEEISPVSTDVPGDQKHIEVNLTTQMLTAYEYNKSIFQTKISSGIPGGDFNTPTGEFYIQEKMPAKHMGYSYFGIGSRGGVVNSFADAEGYALPGIPWTCFFTPAGHAFHGTYWHENFGTPMSHGCINMRTEDAKWIFRWALPPHEAGRTFNRGRGTLVRIDY